MAIYKESFCVTREVFDHINALLEIDDIYEYDGDLDARKDDHLYGTAIDFGGRTIYFDLFSGTNNYWIDWVLVDTKTGEELYVYDADYELSEGEVEFDYGEDTYIVNVVVEDK